MTKQTALKKIEKYNLENANDIKISELCWKRINDRKKKISDLKREFNIGNTLLDESLLNFYKGESRAIALND
jgi:hypothetical protein